MPGTILSDDPDGRPLCPHSTACGDTGSSPEEQRREEQQSLRFATSTALRNSLRFAWMRAGLSPTNGICEAEPWTEAVPANAELVEGDPGADVCRMFVIDIGREYIFAYGRKDVDRKAVTVWRRKTVERGT